MLIQYTYRGINCFFGERIVYLYLRWATGPGLGITVPSDFFGEVMNVYLDVDFYEIRTHLERACDQCLLTKRHCQTCNVERLLGVIESIDRNDFNPTYLISFGDLAVLTNPDSPEYRSMAEKWKGIINREQRGPAI